jgi:hypothetical protein
MWCPGQNKRIAPISLPWMSQKATKGLIAFTPEIDCDQSDGLTPHYYGVSPRLRLPNVDAYVLPNLFSYE